MLAQEPQHHSSSHQTPLSEIAPLQRLDCRPCCDHWANTMPHIGQQINTARTQGLQHSRSPAGAFSLTTQSTSAAVGTWTQSPRRLQRQLNRLPRMNGKRWRQRRRIQAPSKDPSGVLGPRTSSSFAVVSCAENSRPLAEALGCADLLEASMAICGASACAQNGLLPGSKQGQTPATRLPAHR